MNLRTMNGGWGPLGKPPQKLLDRGGEFLRLWEDATKKAIKVHQLKPGPEKARLAKQVAWDKEKIMNMLEEDNG